MRVIFYFISIFIVVSCSFSFSENEIIGEYSAIDFHNNYDTVCLYSNNIYTRKIYDKNRDLILSMDGKFDFNKETELVFYHFYQNCDDDLINNPSLAFDTTMLLNVYVGQVGGGNIGFSIMCGIDSYRYSKVSN